MSRLPDAVPLEQVRRALIVKLRHHGDVLLASPVISVLKNHAPSIDIDALVYSDTAPMLALHPGLSQLHVVDRSWKRANPLARIAAEFALLRALAARRYELLILLTESWRGAWLVHALRTRWAVAPERSDRGRLWRANFTHRVLAPRNGNRHVVESNLDALRRIGIQPGQDERFLVLEAGEEARARVRSLLAEHGLQSQRFVHMHPTSRWQFKGWNVHGWAEVIRRLQGDDWRVVLTGAPDASEREVRAAIQREIARPVVDVGGQLSLKELAALTAEARLFVGVDSAPMHVAAAMRTPVVVLFGPSGETMWGPWGKPRTGRHRVVASRVHSCRPCGLDGCGGGKVSDCLEALEVHAVWQAVSNELEATAIK